MGLLVMLGIVVVVFFFIPGIWRSFATDNGTKRQTRQTQENIRKGIISRSAKMENNFYFISMMFLLSVFIQKKDIQNKGIKGFFYRRGYKTQFLKLPYLRRSYQTKKRCLECTDGSASRYDIACGISHDHCNGIRNSAGCYRRGEKRYLDGYIRNFLQVCWAFLRLHFSWAS